jgi:spore maturation protein CgeB
MRIIIFGLSVTSSWGNGHATTYRGLMRGLAALGHDVTFLEREKLWYANNRDLAAPSYGHVHLYTSLAEVKRKFAQRVRDADLVMVGSYVPEGIELGRWVTSTARGATAFYDLDTPVTLTKLARGESDYLSRDLVPRYDLYLSFTGGPTLRRVQRQFGAREARALYCSVDPMLYFPQKSQPQWDLGYMGTYSADRQPGVDEFVLQAARRWSKARMVVAGPQYPDHICWPQNVERIPHLAPGDHRDFYARQRFTLNVTRAEMRVAGYSPSVRLFEAAACGTPIISDTWRGLKDFFVPGTEILTARSATDVLEYLQDIPEMQRQEIGMNARRRVLQEHTALHRAAELDHYIAKVLGRRTATAEQLSGVKVGARSELPACEVRRPS